MRKRASLCFAKLHHALLMKLPPPIRLHVLIVKSSNPVACLHVLIMRSSCLHVLIMRSSHPFACLHVLIARSSHPCVCLHVLPSDHPDGGKSPSPPTQVFACTWTTPMHVQTACPAAHLPLHPCWALWQDGSCQPWSPVRTTAVIAAATAVAPAPAIEAGPWDLRARTTACFRGRLALGMTASGALEEVPTLRRTPSTGRAATTGGAMAAAAEVGGHCQDQIALPMLMVVVVVVEALGSTCCPHLT